MFPDRIVVGVETETEQMLRDLYEPFLRRG